MTKKSVSGQNKIKEATVNKQIMLERGGLLAVIVTLITAGIEVIQAGEVLGGAIILIVAAWLIWCREHYKENRWKHM